MKAEGAGLDSKARLGGSEAGVADMAPVIEVEANFLVRSNVWQKIAFESSSTFHYQSIEPTTLAILFAL